MLVWTTIALVAWGALAFGAVYPWAYAPLLALTVIIGVGGLIAASRRRGLLEIDRVVLMAFCGVASAIALQLIPLSREILSALSPSADTYLQKFNFPYGAALAIGGSPTRHPLSLGPTATGRSLVFLLSYTALLAGLTHSLHMGGVRRLAHGLVTLGVLLAIIAIVQSVLVRGPEIYGFWTPQYGRRPFGPFINRNHFGGWIVMVLPLAMALVSAGLARGIRQIKPTWRDRLLWLSTTDASVLVLSALASIVMGISLVLSLSRSAITAFGVATLLSVFVVARRQTTVSKRTIAIVYTALVFIIAISWVGVDVVARRFATASVETIGGRLEAWRNAISIVRNFWLSGTGVNTFGVAMMEYQTGQESSLFVQAHNDYLQLAAEGGLLVGIPILIAIFAFIREIRRRFQEGADDTTTYWIRVGAATGLFAIALQEMVEFSLQIPGNAVVFTVIAAIAIHRPAPRRRSASVANAATALPARH